MSKTISVLLLLIVFSMPANAKVHQDVYLVDKVFCTGRALMGKAGVEARQQGYSRQKWEHQLTMMRKDPKSSEFLYAAAGMALLDLDTIYDLMFDLKHGAIPDDYCLEQLADIEEKLKTVKELIYK